MSDSAVSRLWRGLGTSPLSGLFILLDIVEFLVVIALNTFRPLYMREWVAPVEYNLILLHSSQVFAYFVFKKMDTVFPLGYLFVSAVDGLVLGLEIAVSLGYDHPSIGPKGSTTKTALRLTLIACLFACSLLRFIDMIRHMWDKGRLIMVGSAEASNDFVELIRARRVTDRPGSPPFEEEPPES